MKAWQGLGADDEVFGVCVRERERERGERERQTDGQTDRDRDRDMGGNGVARPWCR